METKTHKLRNLFLKLAVILTVSLIYTNSNYHFGDNNHIGQIPDLLAIYDSSYLKNDFYVNYARSITPRFYYVKFLKFFIQFVSMEKAFYLLTLFSNFIIFTITFFTVLLFSKKHIIIPTLSIIALGYFHKFANLGGAGAITDGYLLPQLLAMPFVLAALISSMGGHYKTLIVVSFISLLIHPSLTLITLIPISFLLFTNKKLKTKYLKISVLLALHTVATYFLFYRHTLSHIFSNEEYIYILAYFRHPHHYIPSQFPIEDYRYYIFYTSLLFVSLIYLWFKRINREIVKYFLVTLLVCLGMMVCGYIFVELFPIRFVVELQLFRIVYLVRWMVVVVFPLGVFMFVKNRISEHGANLIFFILIGSLFLKWPYLSIYRLVHPELSVLKEPDKVAIFNFVEENTSANSIFLTPPYFGDMRIIPKRAIVADLKTFPFSEVSMAEWYQRVLDIYGQNKENRNNVYRQISDEKIVYLKEKYNFNYVILYTESETSMCVVYNDGTYKLIDLQ